MIIYNITIKVDAAIQNEWLVWVKDEHVPEILQTNCFTQATILQLLETDNTEGPTYAIQCRAESKALYNQYIENFAGLMRQKSFDKWGDRFIAFRSVLQVIH